MLKKVFDKLSYLALSVFGLFVVTGSAHADAISDAIVDFDTTNILSAGGAIIGLILVIVGIRKVVYLLKTA